MNLWIRAELYTKYREDIVRYGRFQTKYPLKSRNNRRKIKPASEKTVFQKPLKGKDVKALTHPSRQKDRKTNAAVSITKEENNAITVSNLCLNYKPLVKKSIRTLSFLHPNKIPKVEALK